VLLLHWRTGVAAYLSARTHSILPHSTIANAATLRAIWLTFNTFVLTSQAHLGSHLQITQHNTASAPYSRVKASCHAIAAAKGKRQAYHHHHHTCTRAFSVIALSAQRCPLPHTSALVLARAGVSNIPNSHFRKPSRRPRDTFTNNFRALCSRSRKSYAISSLI
jgi:hypothetical protein